MPTIRNLSLDNIVINNKILDPDKTMTISDEDLNNLQGLIERGKIKVEIQAVKRMEVKTKSKKQDTENIKERLVPAFFKLHLNQDLNTQELEDLKWFFINAGPTAKLDQNIKVMLEDVRDTEELIEVLLNHIYPEMVDLFFE